MAIERELQPPPQLEEFPANVYRPLVTAIFQEVIYTGKDYNNIISEDGFNMHQPKLAAPTASPPHEMHTFSTSETIRRQTRTQTHGTLLEMPTSSWDNYSMSSNDGMTVATTPVSCFSVQESKSGSSRDPSLSYSSEVGISIVNQTKLLSQQAAVTSDYGQILLQATTQTSRSVAEAGNKSTALVRNPNRDSYLRCFRAVAAIVPQSTSGSQSQQSDETTTPDMTDERPKCRKDSLKNVSRQETQDRSDSPRSPPVIVSSVQPGTALHDKFNSTTAVPRKDFVGMPLLVHAEGYQARIRTAAKVSPRSPASVDVEEDGGCRLTADVEIQEDVTLIVQNIPKKTPRDDARIRAEFKSRVQEAALSAAQCETIAAARLDSTKSSKFDSLIRKLQVMALLGEETTRSQEVHVFVDMSNVYIGFQNLSKESRGYKHTAWAPYEPFSFEHFSYVLERGRRIGKRHLAGSIRYVKQWNNLPQHFGEARACGYTTKIFQQVEKPDSSHSSRSSPTTSSDEGDNSLGLATLSLRTKLGEQGVDEALHLAMQDSMLEAKEPGTMVLATGDAKPAEFSDGFAHYANKALERGWHIEIVSWRRCLSSDWKRSPFSDKYAGQVRIIELDRFFDEIKADWADPSPQASGAN